MILRSVTRHVRDQNWFAVAIDFMIVVVGVFIGIQVANWNAERADMRLETEILANIVVDLNSDATELASGIRMADANIRAGNYALARAGFESIPVIWLDAENMKISSTIQVEKPPDVLDTEEGQRLWSNLVVRYHPTQSATAFNTLVATGRLGLIRDRALIQQLQGYQQDWNDLEISQNLTYRTFRDRTIFVGQRWGLSPFMRMPEEEFISLVRTEPELAGALRTMLEYAVLHRDQQQLMLGSTHDLLHLLGEKVGE